MSLLRVGSLLVVVAISLVAAVPLAADPPAPPPLSSLMPAADVAGQVQAYIEEMRTALSSEEQFKSAAAKLKKISNTTAVLCLVLAHHDSQTELTKSAPGLLQAAGQLAKAKDYAAAKQALSAIDEALAGKSSGAPVPPWGKVASQGQVMKEASDINTRLRNSLRRFDVRRLAQSARAAATLTAIAQATMFDTHEVSEPTQLPKWYELCGEFRAAAAELATQIRAQDKAGSAAALDRVTKSCEACHAVFYPME